MKKKLSIFLVIVCLLSLFTNVFAAETNNTTLNYKLSLIFRLFFEYSRRENIDSSDIDTLSFEGIIDNCSELSLLVFLVTDYMENGLYSSDKTVYEINGSGDID